MTNTFERNVKKKKSKVFLNIGLPYLQNMHKDAYLCFIDTHAAFLFLLLQTPIFANPL